MTIRVMQVSILILCSTSVAIMSARGLVSIDVRVELSIIALCKVSIDVEELVSIDDARFSLRVERSKRVGSERKKIRPCYFWY